MPHFLKAELMPGVEKNADFSQSWLWDRFLLALPTYEDDSGSRALTSVAVPVNAFREHVLREYVEHIEKTSNILIQVDVKDYKNIVDHHAKVFWICAIRKVVGYRALARWIGATENDGEHDFWLSLGSAEVSGTGVDPEMTDVFLPPKFLEKRWMDDGSYRDGLVSAMKGVNNFRTVAKNFMDAKKGIAEGCRLQVGQRLELLDSSQSSRVRPARVKAICGRRVCVQVLKIDCDIEMEEDRQFGQTAEFWVDQTSFFIFPVGWSTLNGYGIEAKQEYKKHTRAIADSILNNQDPPYSQIDVRPEQLSEWKTLPHAGARWERGMKFELMDPLGATVRDLFVASVLEVLQDGYLKVAPDGPDAEDECIPLHCTSPLLFPAGYAEKYELVLHGPGDSETFNWEGYLKQTKGKVAPEDFFKRVPEPERFEQFQIGAKLEASDMCENLLICPATVVAHKGRVLHIHFDGWADEFDQYFDIDSKDIFPVGWCEIHGYKLECPKDEIPEEPSKKKKKQH